MPEPEIVKNRVHFDLISDPFDAATERLLGMAPAGTANGPGDKSCWTTLADVEGRRV